MATELTISSQIEGGTTIYNKITTNGVYTITLDETLTYIFQFSKLVNTSITVKTKMQDANGAQENFTIIDNNEQLFIDKRDILEIEISNIIGYVKIQSYFK